MNLLLTTAFLHSIRATNAAKVSSLRRPPADEKMARSLADSGSHFLCGSTYCLTNRSTCESNSTCTCLRGWGGPNCEEEQDECKGDTYPCAGGNNSTSFCVDYDPPHFYKCNCYSNHIAVLPNQADVTDPVPASWRPLACVPEEVNPTPSTSLPSTSPSTAPSKTSKICTFDANCKGANFKCQASQCVCKEGHFQVGPNCQLENECRADDLNDCHRDAICINNEATAGYLCACADGFADRYWPQQDRYCLSTGERVFDWYSRLPFGQDLFGPCASSKVGVH